MQYDQVKITIGRVSGCCPFVRKCLYLLLHLLLLRAWHIRKELRRLGKTMPADASVLDAGAGFGQYAWYMAHAGAQWQIDAVDVKTEQVEDCNRFFAQTGLGRRVRFEVADLTTFIRPDTYHLVISVDVMEHIADDVAVFRNLYRSLRQDGVLLLSTPSDCGGSDADEHHESFIDEHVRAGYSTGEIRDKLLSVGFSRVETQYTYGRPGHLSWLLSMKYPLLMLRVSKLFFILLPFYYLMAFPFCLLLNCCDVCTTHRLGTGLKVKAVK